MKRSTDGIAVRTIATAVPHDLYYDNADMIRVHPHSDQFTDEFVENLGVQHRYSLSDPKALLERCGFNYNVETVFDEKRKGLKRDVYMLGAELSAVSFQKALDQTGLTADQITYVVYVTNTPDFQIPGPSAQMFSLCEIAPDTRHVTVAGGGCSAYISGLMVASDYLAAHPEGRVALINTEVNTSLAQIDKEMNIMFDVQFWLFGDGASTTIIENSHDNGFCSMSHFTEVTNLKKKDFTLMHVPEGGTAVQATTRAGKYFHQDIRRVFVRFPDYLNTCIGHLKDKSDFDMAQAAFWAIHTGSGKILDLVRRTLCIDYEKAASSYHILKHIGNLSSASLPFILEHMKGKNMKGTGVALAYGSGFSCRSCLVEF